MNQRPGKTHKAALGDSNQLIRLKNFFKICRDVLEAEGLEDPAYYFEQIYEHLADGGEVSNDKKEVSRILGL